MRRHELALALVAASAVLVAVIVALDVLRFHLPALVAGRHAPPGHHDVALAVLAAADALVLWRLGPALWRQARLQRALRGIHVLGRRAVAGRVVHVVRDPRPLAYCAGLLRPDVFVSDGALAVLGEPELRAVVEHEAHHARRRDPLRLAAAQTTADAFAFLPPLRDLAPSEAALADLAADRAAVAAVGSGAPLAAAMLALEEPAPERVDQLLGRPPVALPRRALAAAATAVGMLVAVLLCSLLAGGHPVVPAWVLPALAAPALLAGRPVAYR